jgi:2-oxo-3-hexenedioate decarboxylase
MAPLTEALDLKAIARDVVASLASHRQVPTFSSRPGGLALADAYRITPLLRAAFEARGETITGRKIGFTNREMWKVYGVEAPIWGYATDHTTHELTHAQVQRVKDFAEPRIEPEIMFGLKAAPLPSMNEAALLDCIEWVSLGYEIVQSIFPDWKFAAPDTVAANGLHGALLVGTRHAIAPRKAEWQHELATFEVELYCNGKLSQRGGGALVLDSPLHALRHLVELLAKDPQNPPLRAGETISTGTLTLAMPVSAGESWTTKVTSIPLEEISLRFE